MYLPHLTTLVVYVVALASASPIAWPDEKLEAINALRAQGISEAEIAARNPRTLTTPSPAPLSEPISFFGRSVVGSADISGAPVGETAKSYGMKRTFRESVGRRGEEISKRL